MRVVKYLSIYLLILALTLTQLVSTLAQSGHVVHTNEELAYLQKEKAQITAALSDEMAKQAMLATPQSLAQKSEIQTGYQPIRQVLAYQENINTTLSLNTQ